MSLTVITQTAISPAASGSDDKIDKWHMHMTRTDGSRGSGSDEKRDKWHMHMTRTDGSSRVVGAVLA